MLEAEAIWFGRVMNAFSAADLYPMLNVGSGTESFRTERQPWIDAHIFAPAKRRGGRIRHTDIQDGAGVDLVGDLTDPRFLEELRSARFRSIFCSNLMEHVAKREEIAMALMECLEGGGLVFASCPYDYPYHPNPIDTLYRPNVEQLAALFPGTSLVMGEIIAGGTYAQSVRRNPLKLVRIAVPLYRPRRWLSAAAHLRWLMRPYKATCVVLRKGAGEGRGAQAESGTRVA